jgi:hypothetical protein
MSVNTVLAVLQILAPVVEELVKYIQGGDKPAIMTSLPTVLQSRLALERAKVRAGQ